MNSKNRKMMSDGCFEYVMVDGCEVEMHSSMKTEILLDFGGLSYFRQCERCEAREVEVYGKKSASGLEASCVGRAAFTLLLREVGVWGRKPCGGSGRRRRGAWIAVRIDPDRRQGSTVKDPRSPEMFTSGLELICLIREDLARLTN